MAKQTSRTALASGIAIIVGTAVGAGIFGIPYAMEQVGLPLGLVILVVIGSIVVVTTLAYGEVVARTKQRHQLPGYVGLYLGPFYRKIAVGAMIFGITGSLIAYLTEIGNFLYTLVGNTLGGSPLVYSVGFFMVAAVAILLGLGMIVQFERVMVVLLIVVLGIVMMIGIPSIDFGNYLRFEPDSLLTPIGVVLFAVAASTAIPATHDLLARKGGAYRRAILIGMILPLVAYALFGTVVVGITGTATTEAAVVGLGVALGSGILYLGAVLGTLTMSTSFLTSGLVLRDMYRYDVSMHRVAAWILAMTPPLIIVIGQWLSFIQILAFVGAVFGGIEGILILLVWRQAKAHGTRTPEYTLRLPHIVQWSIMIVYCIGMLLEVGMLLS